MKKLLFAGMFCVIAACSFGQDLISSEVPAATRDAFNNKFPEAADVEWKLVNNQYRASFEVGSADHEALMDKNGKFIRLRQEISPAILPDGIRETMSRQFSSYMIGDVARITTGKVITYEAELEGKNGDLEVLFDSKGKVLQKRAD